MQILACQEASAAFVAWASAVPWRQVEASVELVLVVVAVVVEELAGLVEAFLVVAAVAVVVAVAAAAVAVVADTDSYSPTDDNIQPTGLCSPVVQQQWLLL